MLLASSLSKHFTFVNHDRRSTEISLVIRQTMEACILTHLMPRSQVIFMEYILCISFLISLFSISLNHFLQIDIFVQVLQADGGRILFPEIYWILNT